jgi:hypothetical protein
VRLGTLMITVSSWDGDGCGDGGVGGVGRGMRVRWEAIISSQGESRFGWLGIDDAVLLTSCVTNFITTFPAGSDATSRRVAAQVGRASSRNTNGVLVTAQDDIGLHAVVGIGLGAIDWDIIAGCLGPDHGCRRGNEEGRASHDDMGLLLSTGRVLMRCLGDKMDS